MIYERAMDIMYPRFKILRDIHDILESAFNTYTKGRVSFVEKNETLNPFRIICERKNQQRHYFSLEYISSIFHT